MSPVPYTWGPFLAKIFLKIDEIKIRPLTPPQNHFNTLPVLVADACIQEGWEKKKKCIRLNLSCKNIFLLFASIFFLQKKKKIFDRQKKMIEGYLTVFFFFYSFF